MQPAKIALLFCITAIQFSHGATFHVTTNGSAAGNGTPQNPWDIVTALNQPSNVLAGDTIFLHGGTYAGNFTSNLNGSQGNYIVVMQYPGERATISDNRQYASGATLQINGSWCSYEEFEVTNSNPNRTSTSSTSFRPMGLQVQGAHTRLLHLIIHDTGHGIGFWKEAVDSEVYGCLIYNCGTQNSPGNYITHGHGIYTQNDNGTKIIEDNVIFNQFGFGVHVYPNPGHVRGYNISGNTLFQNGTLTGTGVRMNNLLVETYAPYQSDYINFSNNCTYDDSPSVAHTTLYDADVLVGDVTGSYNRIRIDSNYFGGNGRAGCIVLNWDSVEFLHNTTFYRNESAGAVVPASSSTAAYSWDFNTYRGVNPLSQFAFQSFPPADFSTWQTQSGFDASGSYTNAAPTGVVVLQQPDRYTAGRSLLTVYNWDTLPSVTFNPQGLNDGDAFEVIDVQNYFGPPVYTGTYNALSPATTIPTTSTAVAAPTGWTAVPHTSAVFNCFIVRKTIANQLAEETSNYLHVFPNPVADMLYVTRTDANASAIDYEVLDITGRCVQSGSMTTGVNGTSRISLAGLSAGTYFFTTTADGIQYTQRFVKSL